MAICQGLGLALAVGIGGAARGAVHRDDGRRSRPGSIPTRPTSTSSPATWFLVTLLAARRHLVMLARGRAVLRIADDRRPAPAIGAIAFAASLAEDGRHRLAGPDPRRRRHRLRGGGRLRRSQGAIGAPEGNEPGSKEADAANFLIVAFAAAGIVLAAFSPVRPAGLAARARGACLPRPSPPPQGGEKYEGLRILR